MFNRQPGVVRHGRFATSLTPEACKDIAPVDDPVEDGGGAWGHEMPKT